MICDIKYCQNYLSGECMLKNNKRVCTEDMKIRR